MKHDNKMICIYRAAHGVEGNLIKGLLQTRGISVRLDGENLAGAYSGVPLASEVRIMVPQTSEDKARDIILEYERGDGLSAVSWACNGCGESNAASFDHCWHCGTDRDDCKAT